MIAIDRSRNALIFYGLMAALLGYRFYLCLQVPLTTDDVFRHLGYSSHITFNDLHVEMDDRTTAPGNQSRRDGGLTGIENANNNRGNRFKGATVQGYPIGLRTNREGKGLDEAAEGISYTNVEKERLALKGKEQRRIRV